MKLLVLHGSAQVASRKKLNEIKQKFAPNNVVVFEKGADLKDIQGVLSTQSLFEEERLVVLEDPSDTFDSLIINHQSSITVVLWFDHEVKTKYEGEVLFFPEDKEVSVFPWLDLLGNRDKRAYLELDKLKRAGYDSQYFIIMIFYLLRNLVATPRKAHDFVKRKNDKMRGNFSSGELINLYKFVLETDFKIKKGLLDSHQADYLLVAQFGNLF